MNMFGYIFGSGIMDKPYVMEISISLCLLLLVGFLFWKGLKKARKEWHFWCLAICGILVYLASASAIYYFYKAIEPEKPTQEPIEKVEYENFESLTYKNCDSISPTTYTRRRNYKSKIECL